MPDLLTPLARRLGCTRGQAATVLVGLVVAVPTFVASVVGVAHAHSGTDRPPTVQQQEQR